MKMIEEISELKERAEKFLKLLGVQAEVEVFNESYCDHRIEIGTSGIGVSITEGKRKTINGTIKCPMYCAFRSEYIIGVRYYADGSGEPDSVEVEDLGEESRNPDQPIIEAIKAYVEAQIVSFLDYENAEAAAEAEEDDYDEL
jgi:hypothetical protein